MTTPRRTFLKKSVKLTATSLLLPHLPIFANDNLTELPTENEANTYNGSQYGTIDHHRPDKEPAGEKFVFIRLKYPGGDWYTNVVDYYRWPSDLRFTQMLDQQTNIDVALYRNPQFVSIDDDYLFAYPYLFVTGHIGFRFSQEQKWRLKVSSQSGGDEVYDDERSVIAESDGDEVDGESDGDDVDDDGRSVIAESDGDEVGDDEGRRE